MRCGVLLGPCGNSSPSVVCSHASCSSVSVLGCAVCMLSVLGESGPQPQAEAQQILCAL